MTQVRFCDRVKDGDLQYAVIVSRSAGKWVFCKHRERDTLECPGGHREAGEPIVQTARRELYEETGAVEYVMSSVCAYEVSREGEPPSYGMLYYADITVFESELTHEIDRIVFMDVLPTEWTYPDIQPILIEELKGRGLVSEHI